MEQLKNYYNKAASFSSFADSYFDHLHNLLKSIDKNELEKFLKILIIAREKGATIYFLGNGGSATTATHYANDLCKFANCDKTKNFKALSLSDNISWFSALANDDGYDTVFVKQLENFIKVGDVVVGISASGNSKNIVRALEFANQKGAISVGIIGFDGGIVKKIAKEIIYIKSDYGEYGPVEDVQMIIDHLICSYISLLTKKDKKKYVA